MKVLRYLLFVYCLEYIFMVCAFLSLEQPCKTPNLTSFKDIEATDGIFGSVEIHRWNFYQALLPFLSKGNAFIQEIL